ncbi:hypothetical protein CEXT_472781 [Caerostris extrusa]|uniref:Uncharacterized protein n=1 Tax=Caerostris extrusa TaxID=172846 RepID=A0AAV4X9B4_CAEEX|nr:hypothetical protein CEXT_472781 [Caerostris extrusa]
MVVAGNAGSVLASSITLREALQLFLPAFPSIDAEIHPCSNAKLPEVPLSKSKALTEQLVWFPIWARNLAEEVKVPMSMSGMGTLIP